MPKVKILWTHPNAEIRRRGPRYLEFKDHEGKRHISPPHMDESGHIFYEVEEEYARALLGEQPDVYKLIAPDQLIVRRRRPDNLGTEYVTIKAVTTGKPEEPLADKVPEVQAEPETLESNFRYGVSDPNPPEAIVQKAGLQAKTEPENVQVPPAAEGVAKPRTGGHKRPKADQ